MSAFGHTQEGIIGTLPGVFINKSSPYVPEKQGLLARLHASRPSATHLDSSAALGLILALETILSGILERLNAPSSLDTDRC